MRVDKFLESEGGPPPRVFARIQRLDDRGRSVPDTVSHVLVPISHDPTQAEAVTLAPGHYAVEVKLPSGELLSDDVRVGDASLQELVLVAAASSRDWLSWHDLGNASGSPQPISKSAFRAARDGPVPDRSRPRNPRLSGSAPRSTRGVPVSRSQGSSAPATLERVGLRVINRAVEALPDDTVAVWEPQRPVEIDVGRALYWLQGGPTKADIDVLRTTDPWRALPALRGSTQHIVDALNAGRPAFFVEPGRIEDITAVFPVPNLSGQGATSDAPGERNFVAVHRRMGVELVCLPTPWIDQLNDREVAIDITVQRPRYEREFASAVSVRDRQLAVLLGFLSSGALPAAKRLAETAGDMLYEKNINPLAAAAGGYALVSSAVDTQRQRWHHWIENLMQRFENVPDGAVQYGTMRMRLRTSESDFNEAARAFKVAYHRGVPFYGLGLRWLLEGLQRVGARDPEAQAMADAVQRLTSRLHPQSPFTILRLGRQ